MGNNKAQVSRRKFIGTTASAFAGITILPSTVVAGLGHKAPSDKLNIAGIGVGGRGFGNLKELESENIVALCDVDWNYSQRVFDYFPDAKKYKDWRVMYDELGKSIDAVMIATPDHTHAGPAAHAITLNKHVYLQKPLAHSVYESRLLSKLAKKYQVATTMGNQGASRDDTSKTIEWLFNGEIGEVKKVEAFTDRPIWPQGLNRPEPGMNIPDYLDWNLFTGPAKRRPYHNLYTPWNWRGWWDFGTGALGDMACHILHPVNEMIVMGVLAVRLQSLNKKLEWDGQNMKFTNIGDDETIRTVVKDGFEIHDGHPTFKKDWTEPVNAIEFTKELVAHTYRSPWTLPGMPEN